MDPIFDVDWVPADIASIVPTNLVDTLEEEGYHRAELRCVSAETVAKNSVLGFLLNLTGQSDGEPLFFVRLVGCGLESHAPTLSSPPLKTEQEARDILTAISETRRKVEG